MRVRLPSSAPVEGSDRCHLGGTYNPQGLSLRLPSRGPRLSTAQLRLVATRSFSPAREVRAVVTEDADFRRWHTVSKTPSKLLLVATGNIRNDDLLALLERRLGDIDAAL